LHIHTTPERELNKNTNGLIRLYFSKKTSFDSINDNDVETAIERLDSRLRKILGIKTPNNIFLENQAVAFNT
jgi:IS30 family transposase